MTRRLLPFTTSRKDCTTETAERSSTKAATLLDGLWNVTTVGLWLLPICFQRSVYAADIVVKSEIASPLLTKIGFGSCHKRKYVQTTKDGINIWDAIRNENPQTFLWTGDSIYPSSRGVAPASQLQEEYQQMITNTSIGYAQFKPPLGIYGTWDDHDYGANDAGKEMPSKQERRQHFWKFLNYSDKLQSRLVNRSGLYHSIDFVYTRTLQQSSSANQTTLIQNPQEERIVKVIILDTRWNRDLHCIPSVAARVPLGAVISCLTRWFLASLGGLPSMCSQNTTILGKEQWEWLSHELETSTAHVHVLVSSIQVFSTNPATEGWGHFPNEQNRLVQLLNSKRPSGLVILSGDVHHAEILDPAHTTGKQTFMEVTSSGLTHSCTTPFYGKLCEPILKHFYTHRRHLHDYYLDRNYGTLQIDWQSQRLQVDIHDKVGNTVLSTGWRLFAWDPLTHEELSHIPRTVNSSNGTWNLVVGSLVMTVLVPIWLWILYSRIRHHQQDGVGVQFVQRRKTD